MQTIQAAHLRAVAPSMLMLTIAGLLTGSVAVAVEPRAPPAVPVASAPVGAPMIARVQSAPVTHGRNAELGSLLETRAYPAPDRHTGRSPFTQDADGFVRSIDDNGYTIYETIEQAPDGYVP